ncbi:MAG: hypothetical protein BGO67_05615 [Alphaproteobacteria bacterium 41-28]|nr:MAG: hypothetical protein BGO67_05615 [Alphaproteobacteria bacterium 41-28]
MFNFCLLSLLLITSSAQAMEDPLFTWDNPKLGTGLHVFAKGEDKEKTPWTLREIRKEDRKPYKDLMRHPDVMKSVQDGKILPKKEIASYVEKWLKRYKEGIPNGRMTVEQGGKPVGCVQVGPMKGQPGFGELARAFVPHVQGKGLGTEALRFIIEDWAPKVREIALSKDTEAPLPGSDQFNCFEGEALRFIYTTTRPSNTASWRSYERFNFRPSPRTNIEERTISCEGWEESQHGPLEEYIVLQYFSSTSPERLQADIFYPMLDEKGNSRTLSYVTEYGSLRYHFEREVD